KAKWKKIQYDLLTRYPVVNEEAFKAKVPAYFTLIERFLNFTKDSLQDVDNISTQTFLQEWFAEERKRDGDAFRPDSYSLLKKKIIERFFNGEIKHYLYAKLFQEALSTANPINLERVYKEYAAKYPDSKNLSLFNNAMEEVFRASRNNLTTGMKFIERGDTIRTFKQLIQIVKGKTLLLDMWGTWCGPCREDIKKHSAAIKAHFKNKPVDYLYVANMDEGNEKGWKELISFFKLEGYHILATRELTKDIMANIKGSGYPSYAIIRPDGSIELSKTQFPMKREVLIQQIEEVLK
ncbi:MAG: TlpA family protein disulfide reductase, partial [Fervidobacterium pennivorans]